MAARVRLRFVTYNIHQCFGGLDAVANTLRALEPDVATLQEVSNIGGDQAVALAAELNMTPATGPNLFFDGGWYGNATLSRFPVASSRNHDLSVPGREPRGCLELILEAAPGPLRVFNAHLGLRAHERRRQARRLTQLAEGSAPRILAGDFNDWSRRSVCPSLSRHLGACRPLRSFPARLPLFALDRIYHDPPLRLLRISTVPSPASDHLPVLAEFDW
ncbi:MAG: endonuclease/exonuclease/phosphatase family protein [Bryobacteraceae bacterium]|nr:endonuclease/exonuclease/phosphatase family protein [Bryobacteraceae bacterium]